MKREPWCPVAFAVRTFSGKWKALVLLNLKDGAQRFGELKRLIPGVTVRALTLQLRGLEADGLVSREDCSTENMLHVRYSLTAKAVSLGAILDALYQWGEDNQPQRKSGIVGAQPEVRPGG